MGSNQISEEHHAPHPKCHPNQSWLDCIEMLKESNKKKIKKNGKEKQACLSYAIHVGKKWGGGCKKKKWKVIILPPDLCSL